MNMQFIAEDVDYVLKSADWLCTVTQVLDALEKIKINKRLQCKAKSHISERPYFYKKTVSVSLLPLCDLLLVKKYIIIIMNNDNNYILKQKKTYKSFSFCCFCTLELCTPKRQNVEQLKS